jgi:hypothetical protein
MGDEVKLVLSFVEDRIRIRTMALTEVMKRWVYRLMVGVAMVGTGWTAGLAGESGAPYRYLIVLENSSRMERQGEVALDAVHRLILGGVGGRIRAEEVLGVWNFRDRVERDRFRPVIWSAGRGREVANYVYRTIRDEGFEREPDLDLAMSAISEAAQETERLTAILVVTGLQPIRGTMVDEEINGLFSRNGAEMRKAKRPFVVVLLMDRGRVLAHGVSPGGGPVYIPPDPESWSAREAAVEPEQGDEVAAAEQAASVGEKPVPVESGEPGVGTAAAGVRPLTVAEIEEQLRQATAERLRAEREAAALLEKEAEALRDTATREVPLENERPRADVEEGVAPTVPAEATVASPGPAPTEPVKPASADVEEKSELKPGFGERLEGAAVPESGMIPRVTEGVDEVAVPGIAMAPEPLTGRWVYLVAGLGLLALALALTWWVFKGTRHRPQPSVISRSMDRRR